MTWIDVESQAFSDASHPSNPSNPANPSTVFYPNTSIPIPKLVKEKRSPNTHSKLVIPVSVFFPDGSQKKMRALVDTGADVCLIKKDLVDKEFLQPAKYPISLGAANSTLLTGGKFDVLVELGIQSVEVNENKPIEIRRPMLAYEAHMKHDIILSYSWLAENDGLVNPKRHGVLFKNEKMCEMFWVAGLPAPHRTSEIITLSPDLLEDSTPIDDPPIPYTKLTNPNKQAKKIVLFGCLSASMCHTA